MGIFALVGGFCILCLMGMPVAYALGLASIIAAFTIDIPQEAVMLKVSAGMSGFSLLAIALHLLAMRAEVMRRRIRTLTILSVDAADRARASAMGSPAQ